MIQVCCTTCLAIRRTQVDEIAVSSRLSRPALIINQPHHRFPCWTNKAMTRLQTLHCAYSVENRLLKKTENSTKSKLAHQLEAEATSTPLLSPFDKSSSVLIMRWHDSHSIAECSKVQKFWWFGILLYPISAVLSLKHWMSYWCFWSLWFRAFD